MVVFGARKCLSPRLLLLLFGHVCSRRRAMVNKLWCRELARKWMHTKQEPPHPRNLTEPRAENRLRCWYLVYRWLMMSLWLLIILCSVLEIGSVHAIGGVEKWPIYLTNWDLALGLVQSLLGAVLVSRRWRAQRRPDFDANALRSGFLERVYSFLFVVVTSLALGVTFTYWSLVHDPRIHHVDALNILIHVCNSLLVLIDFCIAGVPFQLGACWWCPAIGTLYVAFSFVYFVAGGTDKRGQRQIYGILDWERPGRTLGFSMGAVGFLVCIHCAMFMFSKVRDDVCYQKLKSKEEVKEEANGHRNETTIV